MRFFRTVSRVWICGRRFQKLQDEIYILNKNRELVPNLEWDQRYARAYAQLWQEIPAAD